MQITFTRMVIPLIGITFGFFISCSTLSSSSQESENPDSLTEKELKAELQSVNEQIDAGTTSADVYYHKGYLLSQYAQKVEEPGKRTPAYQDMHRTLKKAEELFNNASLPSGKQKVDELLKVAWSSEHNQGVQIMQSDSTLEGKDFEKAAVHFKNATIILPDTAISYKMEARAYYQNHKPGQAISALEQAKQQIGELPAEMLEQLAFLYLEAKQPQKAVAVYEQAESFSADNLNVIHGLANAYISAGAHEKAVELLNRLAENEPDNIIYAQALATEYYYLGSDKLNAILNSTVDKNTKEKLLAEADTLFGKARAQFKNTLSKSSGNNEWQLAFAQFYQNAAAKYQKVLPEVAGDRQEQVEQKIADYLTSSIPLFEKLVQQNPGSSKFWNNLYEAYSYLGMNEKAEEAKSKIN